jgi:ribosomal protein S18 acetylase RimI-like enzyme
MWLSVKFRIVSYSGKYEKSWLECLKEAFYESMYHDTIMKIKPRYESPAIELIAFFEKKVVGFLDTEIVPSKEQLCGDDNNSFGQISLLAVRPNYRRMGVGTLLLKTAIEHLNTQFQISRVECFFREDISIINFLMSLGFEQCSIFYELTFTGDFFDKYSIDLPFGVNPSLLTGFVQEEEYRDLINHYPPEKTNRILVFQVKK